MKTCVSCKHYEAPTNGLAPEGYSRCMHPKNMRVSPVTGANKPILAYCEEQRGTKGNIEKCGPDADWHEPRDDQQPAPAEAAGGLGQ